ncbi:MAG TPA: MFS transporter [Caproiciproducens sp.]|nr:MFS transporter [Caproiciproducens sp.]
MLRKYFSAYLGLPKEIYILFAARVINCMGSFILPLWSLILTQKFGIPKSAAGNFVAALTLVQGPALLVGGKLVDRVGRKKLLITCEIAGSFFYILCGFMKINVLTAVFIMTAASLYTASGPAFDSMIADITTPENRKPCFSLIYLGINIGMTISPLIGGLLFKNYLFLLFLLDAVTTLISAALLAVFIKETKGKTVPAPGSNPVLDENKTVFQVFRKAPVLSLFILIFIFYDFTYSQWNFMLPLQFGDLYGADGARFFSFLAAANAFTVIVFTPLITKLTLRFRPLILISFAGILYFLSFLVFGSAGNFPLFMVAAVVFTLGEIFTTIDIGTFIANHTPSAYRGRVNAMVMFVRGAAGASGPMVMGPVIGLTNYTVSWAIMAVLILAGASGMLLLDRKDVKTAGTVGNSGGAV